MGVQLSSTHLLGFSLRLPTRLAPHRQTGNFPTGLANFFSLTHSRLISHLWVAPEVNPLNGKARSIPVLNPINKYGRTFFFSWYAFPPLLTLTIRKDLNMSQNEYANSNIMGLT